jgi:hypothetical protein
MSSLECRETFAAILGGAAAAIPRPLQNEPGGRLCDRIVVDDQDVHHGRFPV